MNSTILPARVQVQSRQRRYKIRRKEVIIFCDALLHSLGHAGAVVSIVFIGARAMRALNRRYRNKDYPTDVLSFSYGAMEMDCAAFLGEVVIAPEIAVRNARRWRTSPEKELRKLLAHGILHLLGYDHEMDRGRMNRIQNRLSRRKFFRHAPLLFGSAFPVHSSGLNAFNRKP
jgi:probable rRNA maturation factor